MRAGRLAGDGPLGRAMRESTTAGARDRRKEHGLNNLLKNIGIWLVIGLVVLTVVKQFDARQTTQDAIAYSEFMDPAKSGQVESATIEGRTISWTSTDKKKYVTYSPGDIWMVGDLRQGRRQGRGQARGRAELPRADLHLVVPDAAADRRVDLLHAPDAGRRPRRRVLLRQEQGAHARRVEQHGHVRRRRGLRRGQGRSRRARRVPARSVQVPEARRPHSRAAC